MKKYRKIILDNKIIYVDLKGLSFRQRYFGSVVNEEDIYEGYYVNSNSKWNNSYIDTGIAGVIGGSLIGLNRGDFLDEEFNLSELIKENILFSALIALIIIIIIYFVENSLITNSLRGNVEGNKCYKIKFSVKQTNNLATKKISSILIERIIVLITFLSVVGIAYFSGNYLIFAVFLFFIFYYISKLSQQHPHPNTVNYIIIREEWLE